MPLKKVEEAFYPSENLRRAEKELPDFFQIHQRIYCLMELDLDKCRDLFEVIDGRDGRRSTIIISRFPIKSWFDLFWEHTYADACLARITDKRHSYRLEMNGISMREAEK